jgi:hypothetical protein
MNIPRELSDTTLAEKQLNSSQEWYTGIQGTLYQHRTKNV